MPLSSSVYLAAAATAAVVALSSAYQYDETCDGELQITSYETSAKRDSDTDGTKFPPLPLTQGSALVGQPYQPGTVSQQFNLQTGFYKLEVRTFVCASLDVIGGSLVAFEGSCDFDVDEAGGGTECNLFLIDQEELAAQTISGNFLPQITSLKASPYLVQVRDGLENNSTITVNGYDMDTDAKADGGWYYNFEVTDKDSTPSNSEAQFRQLSYSDFHDNVEDSVAKSTNFAACVNQETCQAHLQPKDTATGSVFFKISMFDKDSNEVFVTGSVGVDSAREQGVQVMMLNKPFVCLDTSVVMCRTANLGPRIISPDSVVQANIDHTNGVINGAGETYGSSNTVYMEDVTYSNGFLADVEDTVITIQVAVKDTDIAYTLNGKTDDVKLSTVTIVEEYSTLPADSDGRKKPGCGTIVGTYGYADGTALSSNDPQDTILFQVQWKPFSASSPGGGYTGPEHYLESRCRLTIQAEDNSADHGEIGSNLLSNTIVKEFIVGGKRALRDLEAYRGVPVVHAFLQGNDRPVVSPTSCTSKSEHSSAELASVDTTPITQDYCSETCSQVIFNHEGPSQSDRRFSLWSS